MVFSLILVGKSTVLHSRQWSVGPSSGGWGSSAPTSLPVGSLLVGLFLKIRSSCWLQWAQLGGSRIFIRIFIHPMLLALCSRNQNCDKKEQTVWLPLAWMHSIPFCNECPINLNTTTLAVHLFVYILLHFLEDFHLTNPKIRSHCAKFADYLLREMTRDNRAGFQSW